MRYTMSLLYIAAGILHFVRPRIYLSIMPEYLPFPIQLIYISGLFEILSGLLLLFPSTRIPGAWLTIFTLIIVFPANIQMAVTFYKGSNPYLWVALLRLPLQFALIWWAWLYTKP
jgi:uncharacterized membrane protein